MADICGLITLAVVITVGILLKCVTHKKLDAMDGLGTVRACGARDPDHNVGDL